MSKANNNKTVKLVQAPKLWLVIIETLIDL